MVFPGKRHMGARGVKKVRRGIDKKPLERRGGSGEGDRLSPAPLHRS